MSLTEEQKEKIKLRFGLNFKLEEEKMKVFKASDFNERTSQRRH